MKITATMETDGTPNYDIRAIADWVQLLFSDAAEECQFPELTLEATEEEYQAFGKYFLDVCRLPEELFTLIKRAKNP